MRRANEGDVAAGSRLEAEEPLGLGQRQLQAGHFAELPSNPFNERLDFHDGLFG